MALTGQGLASFALSKLGTPYVYGAKGANGKFTETKLNFLARSYPSVFTKTYIAKARRFIGKVCCDCSGLISWYTGKEIGSAQLYQTAQTKKRINKSDLSDIPVGAVLWKEGHVGVYVGNGYLVEEMGIDYGCVKTRVKDRTFTHYLTFSYMTYNKKKSTTVSTDTKKNPYTKPTKMVKFGDNGNLVKWVQYELNEAGYKISIDGVFGTSTLTAVRKFQKSCKITVDGVVGSKTIKKLVADK